MAETWEIGDRVSWLEDFPALGTVVQVRDMDIKVHWDDGVECWYAIDHSAIEHAAPPAPESSGTREAPSDG